MLRSNPTRHALMLVLLLLSLSAAGCGGEEEKASPAAPAPTGTPAGTPSDPASEAAEQTTPRPRRNAPAAEPAPSMREALRAEVEVPRDYPTDAPTYPGSTASLAETFGERASVTFVTTDDAERVVAYIENDLASKGWENVRTESMPNGSVTHGTKSSRTVSVMTARIEDADPVTMMMVAVDQ